MKTFLKILTICAGMALLVYSETKLIPFFVCTFDFVIDVGILIFILCIFLFVTTLIIWGVKNQKEVTWTPPIIGLLMIICQIIIGFYLSHRYGKAMEVNRYGHFWIKGKKIGGGERRYIGLADKWGNEVIPPFYLRIVDCGEYAKLFKSEQDSIKYDFYEEEFIEYKPVDVTESESYEIDCGLSSKFFPNTFFKVKGNDDDHYGVIKKEGDVKKIVVPLEFSSLISLHEEHEMCFLQAGYFKDDHYYDRIYTCDGELLLPTNGDYTFYLKNWNPSGSNKKNYFCWVARKNKKTAILDLNGNSIIPFEKGFHDITPRAEKTKNYCVYYFIVEKGKYMGLYDYKGEAIIEPNEYTNVWVETYDSDNDVYIKIDGDYIAYPKELIGKTNPSCYKYCDNPYVFRDKKSQGTETTSTQGGETPTTPASSHTSVPMQVWVPCQVCFNSGVCQTYGCVNGWNSGTNMSCLSCGGSGRCSFCAGKGGHYEVKYY